MQQIFTSLAAVHERGITTAICGRRACTSPEGAELMTDFDYARISGRPGSPGRSGRPLGPDFAAPEVLLDLAAASPRSDVFSAAAISLALGRSVHGATRNRWRLQQVAVFKCAWRRNRAERPARRQGVGGDDYEPLVRITMDHLVVNDVIDHRFVVRERADTTGGTAVVYRVFDQKLQAEFAAKFVRPELSGNVDVFDEFNGSEVSGPPGIVRPAFPINSSPSPGKQEHRFESAFLLTDWVQGVSLAELLSTVFRLSESCRSAR